MMSQSIKSTCKICNSNFARSGMARHLKSCLGKHFASIPEGQTKPLYHLHIYARYIPDFFIHTLVDENASLDDLDGFLRDIWLECCGHMSSFMNPSNRQEIAMKSKISQAFKLGTSLDYLYDFGSTTELVVKCIEVYDGTSASEDAIQIISRNTQPPTLCDKCGKNQADTICTECQWDGSGWLCGKCAEDHECGDEMFLPVVNSPRAGVCGYEG